MDEIIWVLALAFAFVLLMGISFSLIYFPILIIRKAFKAISKTISDTFLAASVPHSIRRSLQEARYNAKKIRITVEQTPPGLMRNRLEQTTKPVDNWLVNLNRLEHALSKLYTQHDPKRELRNADREIEQIRRQLLAANSREEVASLRDLMNSKKRHRAVIKELLAFQNQAELKIRRIASDLGRAHSEILLVSARGDFNDNRFQRLDENLQNNLSGLRDILTVMDEMGYGGASGY